jgi:hypothetical protein
MSVTEVWLRDGGPDIPDAVLLALDLEARHCHLDIDGDILVVGPSELLTDTDRAAIRRWKPELLMLVRYCDERVRETQRT